MAAVERETSALGFSLFFMSLVLAVHVVTWLVWKAAYSIVMLMPKAKSA